MEELTIKKTSFFERIKRGFYLALESIRFIFAHKKLLVFPLMMLGIALLCIGLYELFLYKIYGVHITASSLFEFERSAGRRGRTNLSLAGMLMWAAVYFISLIIATFTNIGLAFATTQAFNGQKISLCQSIRKSLMRFKTVVAWVFYAFLIRIMVGIFTGEGERERRHWSLELIGEMVTIAWTIINFLIAPVLAFEQWDALRSIHRSAYLMRQAFGEFIGATFSFAGIIGGIVISAVAIGFGGLIIFVKLARGLEKSEIIAYWLPVVIVLTVITIILCSFISAAATVFKTATYHYAAGNPIGFFTTQQIKQNFIENSVALPQGIHLEKDNADYAPSVHKGTIETLGNIVALTGITKFLKSIVKGLQLTLHCFRMFYHNGRLFIFPVLSGIVSALTLALWFAGILVLIVLSKNTAFFGYMIGATLALIMLYVIPLIIAVFNVGLTHASIAMFETGTFNAGKSLLIAMRLLPTLLVWALVNSVLRFFATSTPGSSVAGVPYGGLRGIWWMVTHVSWSILSFFLYPIIVQEHVGLFEDLKRSADLASEYFGQSVGAAIATSFIRKIAFDVWFFSFGACIFLALGIFKFIPGSTLGNVLSGIIVGGAFLIPFIILFTVLGIGSAITAMFHAVVYQYARKRPTGIFDTHLLKDVLNVN